MKKKVERRRCFPTVEEVRAASTKKARRKLAKKYGLKGNGIKILYRSVRDTDKEKTC